jgi:hypothetical protein
MPIPQPAKKIEFYGNQSPGINFEAIALGYSGSTGSMEISAILKINYLDEPAI